jgi:hypothetical protein
MHMLGTVISKVQQKVGILMGQWFAKASQVKKLCSTIIVAGIDQVTLIAQYIKFQFAQIKLNIKPYLALFTNQVPLIKAGIMTVLHKVGQLGQQLLTTVRKIPQHVLSLAKRDK